MIEKESLFPDTILQSFLITTTMGALKVRLSRLKKNINYWNWSLPKFKPGNFFDRFFCGKQDSKRILREHIFIVFTELLNVKSSFCKKMKSF